MVKFTKEQDELLIESVKSNRLLFDASDKDHKNYVLKHKCWEEISSVVALPVSDCKKRWKSLRDQFNKKRRGGAEVTNSSWEYMSIMSFLLDTDERRETFTNLDEDHSVDEVHNKDERQSGEKNEEELNEENEEELSYQQNKEELNYQLSEEEEPIGDEISKDDDQNTDEITVPQIKRRATKRNSSEPMKVFAKRDAQSSVSYDKMINNPWNHKTPMQKFFESMADIADTLPPPVQAEIRLKVCQIVTDAEIKHHRQHVQYPNQQSSLFDPLSSFQYVNTPNSQHNIKSNAIGRFKLEIE